MQYMCTIEEVINTHVSTIR